MDRNIRSLLLSFALGLTSDLEDQMVIQLLHENPKHLTFVLSIEKEITKNCEKIGIKKKNQSLVTRKLNKYGLL